MSKASSTVCDVTGAGLWMANTVSFMADAERRVAQEYY